MKKHNNNHPVETNVLFGHRIDDCPVPEHTAHRDRKPLVVLRSSEDSSWNEMTVGINLAARFWRRQPRRW